MISPLKQTATLDLRHEKLPPAWLRRAPTHPDREETPAPNVWRTGPRLAFRDALVDGLDHTREVALVSSFLLSDATLAKAMHQAADRGVRVYVLTASKQRLQKVLGDDDHFDRRMAEEHEKLLDGLAGKVLLRSADHLHAKFLVTDPGPEARAWLSTANFNKGLADNVEIGVALGAEAANAVAGHFRSAFWTEADQELRERGRLSAVKARPAIVAPPRGQSGVYVTATGRTELKDAVLNLVAHSQRELTVASYGLDVDHESVRALLDAQARGVTVTVLTRPRKAVAAAMRTLAEAGVRILAHDQLHAKVVAADGRVMVMTANLQAHGLDSGFEVGAVLAPSAANAVLETLRTWTRTFPWEYHLAAPRGGHLGDLLLADLGLRGGEGSVTRTTSVPIPLPAVTATSAIDLASAQKPVLTPPTAHTEFPQQVDFTWEVLPPKLPRDAKERLQVVEREVQEKNGTTKKIQERKPFKPRIFDHAGRVFVKVDEPADIERARQVAASLGGVVVV